eukprot:COSAG03_NODE_7832_length_868_cov_1.300390_2_plen_30_part_01
MLVSALALLGGSLALGPAPPDCSLNGEKKG